MTLNINTPLGQESLAHEQELCAAIARETKYRVVQTPKWEAAAVDGFLCTGSEVCGLIENKCRNLTLAQLRQWGNEWLITHDKLVRGAALAKALKVPFFGVLYLVPDGIALSIRLTDKEGNLLPNIRLERTETQATINGGRKVRTNAYVNMQGAKHIQVRREPQNDTDLG
jgi:hypothetical protein